jgi:hypothetical protein
MTTELGLPFGLVDPSRFRVRDLPLRDRCSFFVDALNVGIATEIGFELCFLEDLARDELRGRRSEDDDEEDDDTGFESSLDADLVFDIFGGLFLLARTGCSSFRFKWLVGGAIGAHEASELIGFFIHVAILIASSLLFFLSKSLLPSRSLCRKEIGEVVSTASKPELSSSLNATHSSFILCKTMLIGTRIDTFLPLIW